MESLNNYNFDRRSYNELCLKFNKAMTCNDTHAVPHVERILGYSDNLLSEIDRAIRKLEFIGKLREEQSLSESEKVEYDVEYHDKKYQLGTLIKEITALEKRMRGYVS